MVLLLVFWADPIKVLQVTIVNPSGTYKIPQTNADLLILIDCVATAQS